jgi:hypothetical protein
VSKKSRRNRKIKKQRETKRRHKVQKNRTDENSFTDFQLDDRISVLGITAQMTESSVQVASDLEYVIQDNPSQVIAVRVVPQSLLDKLKAVSNKFTLGVIPQEDNREHQEMIANTWPSEWTYLSAEQVEKLKDDGVIKLEAFLMENIASLKFGEVIFRDTHVQKFLDTLTEISWIDYTIRQQLAYYENIYDPRYVTIGVNFEFNSHVAKCWMTLENCVIRIAGLWNRMSSFLLPLYFLGNIFDKLEPPLNNKNPWADLNQRILDVISNNLDQKSYYDLFVTAARHFEDSTFKNLRNRVVHEFVYRPEGVVPTGSDDIPTPRTIEDLHEMVLAELDKAREAVIILAAMMLRKYPKNEMQNT